MIEIQQFEDAGATEFHACEPVVAPIKAAFAVGGVRVQISGNSASDVALLPTLQAFRTNDPAFDIHIDVQWVPSIDRLQRRTAFDSGTTWKLYGNDSGFAFDFRSAIAGSSPFKRLLVDTKFTSAVLQMSERYFDGLSCVPEPLGYPLDELLIMHRLTQEKAIELHGCGIVRADGIGNLFAGHSGAGKSTITRLWTGREDVLVLSDDRIIVRNEKAENAQRMRMYGTPWHGEAMYASPESAPVGRIFILEHGHGNVISPLSPSEAVAELFARSFVPFHRHEYVESALGFLQEVVDAVPCYRFAFEPTETAVDAILSFHD
jgi:hypothetical protein